VEYKTDNKINLPPRNERNRERDEKYKTATKAVQKIRTEMSVSNHIELSNFSGSSKNNLNLLDHIFPLMRAEFE
jgi:hypothetical protein